MGGGGGGAGPGRERELGLGLRLRTLDAAFVGGRVEEAHVLPLLRRHAGTLRCLNLGGPGCVAGGAVLRALPPGLRCVDLCECAALRSITPLTKLPRLSSLGLDGCTVRPAELLAVCAACPLTALNLAWGQQGRGAGGGGSGGGAASGWLDDDTLCAALRLLPRLLSLELRGWSSLTPRAVHAACELCPRLLYLGLGNTSIDDFDSAPARHALESAVQLLPACNLAVSARTHDRLLAQARAHTR
eukprot:g6545.t1